MEFKKAKSQKIFDRFYRVEGNDLISGFGIGLYVSSEIIKLHGGKIWVNSDLGKARYLGLRFLFHSIICFVKKGTTLDEGLNVTRHLFC